MDIRKATKAMSNIKSIDRAIRNLNKFLDSLESVPSEELDRTASQIKAKAIAQTPYRTGVLERSVYVDVVKDSTQQTIIAGASAKSERGYDYAGIQHENTTFNHPVKGKAHYISDPFKQEVYNMKRRIRRRLKKPK